MSNVPRGDVLNVMGPALLVSDKTNSVQKTYNVDDGLAGEKEDELSIDLSNEELIDLHKKHVSQYDTYYGPIKLRQEGNKKYRYGMQDQVAAYFTGKPIPDNLLLEVSDTIKANALARNPDPVVFSDDSDVGTDLSRNVRGMLYYLAEALALRANMKTMFDHWDVYFIGILKHGWDKDIHEISTDVRNPCNFYFDPNGYVDAYGDFVGWLGEKITASAATLIEMYPNKEQLISELVEYKLGTLVTWYEWWEDEYTFTVFKGQVLDKSRNPHFNYPRKMPEARGDQVIEVLKEGNNHFARPKKPYTFLSVYSLREQPHDETSLLEQNKANQDYITERTKQLARNLKRANNSIVFAVDMGMDEQKAKQAADGIEDGSPVLENQQNSIRRLEMPGVDKSFFDELEMRINNMRSIAGVSGSIPQEPNQDTTARGQILNQQRSADRLAGTIGDSLNTVAANVFNWWVQLMHVYYDQTHTAAIMGKLNAVEEIALSFDAFDRRMVITASPDSMKPKDMLTEANQALSLFESGIPIDPLNVLQLMDFPDAQGSLEGGLLYKTNVQQYIASKFPQVAEQMAAPMQPQAGAPPSPAGGQVPPQEPPTTAALPENPSLSQVPLPH